MEPRLSLKNKTIVESKFEILCVQTKGKALIFKMFRPYTTNVNGLETCALLFPCVLSTVISSTANECKVTRNA